MPAVSTNPLLTRHDPFNPPPLSEILASHSLAANGSPYSLRTVAISEGQFSIGTSTNLWAIGERRRGE